MFDKMIYGMEFYRQPGPDLEELKKDMLLLKEKGFSLLRIQEVWSYEEPRQGVYDLDKIKGMVSFAEEIGLELIMTFTLECVPPWLYKFNDVFQRNAYGEPVIETTPYPLPADGKPGPCWDNPIARDAAERFVRKFIEEIGDSEAIKGWAVWQEAGIWKWNDSRGPGGSTYCYCEHTLEKFRLWLKEKYGTLEAMNAKLLTNYGDWSYIAPPNGYNNSYMVPLASEFFHFMLERMGHIAAWKKEMVNRYDKRKRPVMCHVNGGTLMSGIGNKWDDEYVLAQPMDIFGMSLYPKWGYGNTPNKALEYVMLASDTNRCAAGGKEVWAAEMQVARQASGLKRSAPPTEQEIRNWTFATLARGIKGIVYWQYREELLLQEAFGHGVLNRRGEPEPWLEGVAGMLRFLQRHDNLIRKGCLPSSKVAIAVNLDSHLLGFQCQSEELAVNSARNIYYTLLERNVYADFLWNQQVMNGDLGRYEMVFLPFPLSMSRGYAEKLKEYVKAGGTLISAACPATFDEVSNATLASPAYGLDEVFGGAEQAYYDMDDPSIASWDGGNCSLKGESQYAGTAVQPAHMIQTYRLTTGKEIFHIRHETAGILNHYGKGKALLLGTLFGFNRENTGVIDRILASEGISGEGAVEVMKTELLAEDGKAVFLFNRTDRECSVSLEEADGSMIRDYYGGVLSQDGNTVRISLQAGSSACVIL